METWERGEGDSPAQGGLGKKQLMGPEVGMDICWGIRA